MLVFGLAGAQAHSIRARGGGGRQDDERGGARLALLSYVSIIQNDKKDNYDICKFRIQIMKQKIKILDL